MSGIDLIIKDEPTTTGIPAISTEIISP